MKNDKLEQSEITLHKKTASTDSRKTEIKKLYMRNLKTSVGSFIKQILAYFKFSTVLLSIVRWRFLARRS